MELRSRGIKIFFFFFETPNKNLFNKLSTKKKNTQNYLFLRYYNAIIYENGTHRLQLLHTIDKNHTHKHSTTNQ